MHVVVPVDLVVLDQGRPAANHSPLPVPIPFPFPFHAKNQFFISPLNLH